MYDNSNYSDHPEDNLLIDTKIHHWTILQEAYGPGANIERYLLRCQCGNEKIFKKSEFRRLPKACSACLINPECLVSGYYNKEASLKGTSNKGRE